MNPRSPMQTMVELELVDERTYSGKKGDSRIIRVGAGALPQFQIGTAWKNQSRLDSARRPRKQFEFALRAESIEVVGSYDQYAPNRYHLSPSSYKINRTVADSRVARFETTNGRSVYIPCAEIARMWYLRSSLLANHLLSKTVAATWDALVDHPSYGVLGQGSRLASLILKANCHRATAELLALAAASHEYRVGLSSLSSSIVAAKANGQSRINIEARPPQRAGVIPIDCSAVTLLRDPTEPKAFLVTRLLNAPVPATDCAPPECRVLSDRINRPSGTPRAEAESTRDGFPSQGRSNVSTRLEIDEAEEPSKTARGAKTSSLVGQLANLPTIRFFDIEVEGLPGGEPREAIAQAFQEPELITAPASTAIGKSSGNHRKFEVVDHKSRVAPRLPFVESLNQIASALVRRDHWSDYEYLPVGLGKTVRQLDVSEYCFATEIWCDDEEFDGLSARQINWLKEGKRLRTAAAFMIRYKAQPVYAIDIEAHAAGRAKPRTYKWLLAQPTAVRSEGMNEIRQTMIECLGVWPSEISGFYTRTFVHSWSNLERLANAIELQVKDWISASQKQHDHCEPPQASVL